jgi:hypothetical protein
MSYPSSDSIPNSYEDVAPLRFPKQDSQYNEELLLHMQTHVPQDASYDASTDPMFGANNSNHVYLPNDLFNNYNNVAPALGTYEEKQAWENFSGFGFDYTGNDNTDPFYYINGELQFNSPVSALDQFLSPHYQTDTNANWLLAQPVPALDHYVNPASQDSPEDTSSSGTWEPKTVDPALLHSSNPSAAQEQYPRTSKPAKQQPIADASSIAEQNASGSSFTKEQSSSEDPVSEGLEASPPSQQDAAAAHRSGARTTKSPDPKTGRFFDNYEKVVLAKSQIAWTAPADDGSIPETAEEIAAVVAALVNAIRNNAGCVEKSDSKSFVNRWGANATYYEAEEIEMIAWDAVVSPDANHPSIPNTNIRKNRCS